MNLESKIYIAGHRGLVGSALVRRFRALGYENLVTASRDQVDLRRQAAVEDWFEQSRPEYVVVAAGTVGGIAANSSRPAEFLYDNLMIHANVLHAAFRLGVKKLLYLGSSCIYPRLAPQPMPEEAILTGPLEPTNEAYALAKISGIRLCQAYRRQYGCRFIAAMPTNLYGPGDNFDLESSHVIPALIRKFHEAREAEAPEVEVWGSGAAMREFLHVEDLADCCHFLLEHYDGVEHINVGTGRDLSIRDLAALISKVVYPQASVRFDRSRPDGSPRKLLDVRRLFELGWRPKIELETGLRATYRWYRESLALAASPSA